MARFVIPNFNTISLWLVGLGKPDCRCGVRVGLEVVVRSIRHDRDVMK